MAATDEIPCARLGGPLRGRGASSDPPNRFDRLQLHVLSDHLEACRLEHPEGRQEPTQALNERTVRIINRVDSPDLGFNWTINPYRGCEHGCVYCYARPTHETLGFSCGLDFETRIVAKRDAPRLLRIELAAPRWAGETIAMCGVTDAYQPLERRLGLTRGCLEAMVEVRQPVSIVTKSRMVTRDADLLADLAADGAARVAVSLTTLDTQLSQRMEPRASAPRDRLRAMRELVDAGVPVTAMIAPVIPGLNDREVPRLLEAAAETGADSAAWLLLRLPHQVSTIFERWLHEHLPDRAHRVMAAVRGSRNGRLNDARFGSRMRGSGPLANQIKSIFDLYRRRCGLDRPPPPLSSDAFHQARRRKQPTLFDA